MPLPYETVLSSGTGIISNLEKSLFFSVSDNSDFKKKLLFNLFTLEKKS